MIPRFSPVFPVIYCLCSKLPLPTRKHSTSSAKSQCWSCHLWPSRQVSLLLNVKKSGSRVWSCLLKKFKTQIGLLHRDRQRCSEDRALIKKYARRMLPWTASPTFYCISLTRNKSQERIPLIQHYLATGSLIIFHRGAAQRPRRQVR